jgi:hypothetical protein
VARVAAGRKLADPELKLVTVRADEADAPLEFGPSQSVN